MWNSSSEEDDLSIFNILFLYSSAAFDLERRKIKIKHDCSRTPA
jgi:hypothetical protein